MSAPTKPLTPALLLTTAALLSFRATARDRSGSSLGVLVDVAGVPQHLMLASAGADETWELSSSVPYGVKPFLVYESAANVLRGGSLNDDGSISYQGGSYGIETSIDGTTRTAKVKGRS